MYINNLNQLSSFFVFICVGFLICILFDVFRVFRRVFKTPDIVTYVEDIVFWIISGSITLLSIFIFNNGELRLYIFIGIIIGTILYILFISKYFIKIGVVVINTVKNFFICIIQILAKPYNIVQKIIKLLLIKPIVFFIFNFRKNIKIFDKKLDKNKGF